MADPCPLCGLNRELVGIRHNCRPVVNTPTPVVNSVVNMPVAVVNTVDRRALYRERNRALCKVSGGYGQETRVYTVSRSTAGASAKGSPEVRKHGGALANRD
jgi:hypothetical protein